MVVARQPRDHGVGVALGDHARGENVAVLVDHALAVAEQLAFALHALVHGVDVTLRRFGQFGVGDLHPVQVGQAQFAQFLVHFCFAADQNGKPIACIVERHGGADGFLFFAFGEHHAAGM